MTSHRRFVTSVAWSMLGNAANNLVGFAVFAVIVRLVDPTAIGVLAFAVVFVDMGKIFVSAGVPDLIVRQKEWSDDYANMCFWLNMLVGALSALVVVFIVGPLADANFAAGTTPILAVLASCFLIDAARVVPESRLRREFNFRALARRGLIANVLSGVLGIGMALTGWGIWALVAQRVSSSLLTTLFTLAAAGWFPRLKVSFEGAGAAAAHGFGLAGAALLRLLTARLPDLMLGLFLGPVSVAMYRVGARGFEALFQLAVHPVGSVSLSSFARKEHEGTLGRAYLSTLRALSVLIFPLFLGAAALSGQFVALIFGPNWDESAVVMAILCAAAPAAMASALLHAALSAAHNTKLIFFLFAVSAGSTLLVLLVSVPFFGLVWSAAALAARTYLGIVFSTILAAKSIGVTPPQALRAALPSLVSSWVMLGALLALATVLHNQHILVQIPLLVAAGIVVYAFMMGVIFRRSTVAALSGASEIFPQLAKLHPPAAWTKFLGRTGLRGRKAGLGR
ncbi:Polysaccharide biosynthesis protein [Devosia sp. LC5]|uniref:oligosaccharide flippase family protein n=1 Tax=Devosia sp. LC5 TaxID=1502724 RepID=UPI0004E31F74|nr:oligosaccharide flippase family protein [Devosia sp. LC5]KFC62682.1 Polysaccharide biosynthesis protein [Devosia sp. LC5]